MRVTNNMMNSSFVSNINSSAEKMLKLSNQISSQKKLQRPSDNPVDAAKSLMLRASLKQVEQFKRNLDDSQTWLDETEAMITSGLNITKEIRDLVLQANNGINSQEDLTSIKNSIDSLRLELKTVANHSVTGRYIFAGTKTTSQPFASDPADTTYSGNSQSLEREVTPSTKMSVNVSGDEMFAVDSSQPYGALLPDGVTLNSIFAVLTMVTDKLSGLPDINDYGFYIDKIDQSLENQYDKLGEVGAKGARIELLQGQHENSTVTLTAYLSKNEDIDFTKAVSDLQLQQNIYEATLGASAMLMQVSLLDFLR